MTDPSAGLGLGGFGTAITTIELLLLIIKTTKEAQQLKTECQEVQISANTLYSVLQENSRALEDVKTEPLLRKTLMELASFVLECKDQNFFNRVWELTWTKNLPRLLKDMTMWIALLNVEVSVSLRAQMLKLLTSVEQLTVHRETDTAVILEKLEILYERQKASKYADAGNFKIEFPEEDIRLTVDKISDKMIGKLHHINKTTSELNIVGEPIDDSTPGFNQSPRHVFIYAKLSARTLVHPFYGIAQRSGRKWAIMQDFQDCKSLENTILDGNMPEEVVERIEIARHIVRTVEYLHSVDILVKILSGKNVLLHKSRHEIKPYLTSLEDARLIFEDSVGGDYDVRFEAPELQKRLGSRRDVYTDIWSLGVLIWSCTFGTVPFAKSGGYELSKQDIEETRKAIAKNEMPWTNMKLKNPLLNQVLQVVKSCCNPRSDARPSAKQIEDQLRKIVNLGPIVSVAADPEEIKEAVSLKLEEKTNPKPLSDTEVQTLHILSANGDGNAAYLLGLAIKEDRTPADNDVEQLLLVSATKGLEERRLRSALVYMEQAMRAGIKPAAAQLMEIHWQMSDLYRMQAQQYRDLKAF